MKKVILMALAFWPVQILIAQTDVYGQTNNSISWHRDSVYSKTLKEKRKIWVSVPEPEDDAVYGSQHYPVLYVLDGDLQRTLAAMVQDMESGSSNGNLGFPKMIVVAISTTSNRTRDLTPTHSNGAPMQDSLSTV